MNTADKQVSIKVGSEKLVGILVIPQVPNTSSFPSVMILHGRGSSKKRYMDRARALGEQGFLTLVFDFRGCGESEGKLSDQTIAMGLEDATAGYDFLAAHKLCNKEKIGILGGSYGGYHAALLTEKRPIKSLVLAAPAIYQDEWWDKVPESMDPDRKALYRQQADLENTKALRVIRKYTQPLLIIEHERDEVIPQRVTQAYFDDATNASVKEKKVIQGAPHAIYDKKFLQQSTELVTSWFKKTLS